MEWLLLYVVLQLPVRKSKGIYLESGHPWPSMYVLLSLRFLLTVKAPMLELGTIQAYLSHWVTRSSEVYVKLAWLIYKWPVLRIEPQTFSSWVKSLTMHLVTYALQYSTTICHGYIAVVFLTGAQMMTHPHSISKSIVQLAKPRCAQVVGYVEIMSTVMSWKAAAKWLLSRLAE